MNRLPVCKSGLALLVLLIAAFAAAGMPAVAQADGFTARLYASTHEPRVGKWSFKITATRGSQKLSGSVSYQYLHQGTVVATRAGHVSPTAYIATR